MMNKKTIIILLVFSFIGTLFLSIGYAKVSGDLVVEGDVQLRSQSGVVITKVEEVSSNGEVKSKINHYAGTVLRNSLTLDKDFLSHVVYKIDFLNNSNEDYQFIDLLYDTNNDYEWYSNPFIIPTVLTSEDVSYSDMMSLGDILPVGKHKSVYVKYHYDTLSSHYNGTISGEDQVLEGIVNYHFAPIHKVVYVDLYAADFPIRVLDGEKIEFNFKENNPSKIEVYDLYGNYLEEGKDYEYNGSRFEIYKVTSSITIKGVYS